MAVGQLCWDKQYLNTWNYLTVCKQMIDIK